MTTTEKQELVAQWEQGGPVWKRLNSLGLSDRVLRLFGVACCRRIRHLMTDPRSLAAVDGAEAYADGKIGAKELGRLEDAAYASYSAAAAASASAASVSAASAASVSAASAASVSVAAASYSASAASYSAASAASAYASASAAASAASAYASASAASAYASASAASVSAAATNENHAQAQILWDFVPPDFAFKPGWRTFSVLALAEGIYADKAFDRFPILADALQDAGMGDTPEEAEFLERMRTRTERYRGDWVVDVILGKR